jgi:hypothetical protein
MASPTASLMSHVGDETYRLEPIENPFGPKLLPMCPE